jgi:putative membrane protein
VTHKEGNFFHLFLFFLVLILFLWSLIKPEEGFFIWLLEVVPAVVSLIFVVATYNKFRLTTLSYVIIALLSILTFIGGHYSYSKVPLFNWFKDYFDLQRNHYDRFGHFLKGLIVLVILEILLRKTTLTKSKITTFIALCITLAMGAFYEIIEWASTKIPKGEKATKDFLGMQGDIWDAQWDMTLLLVGSILAVIFLSKLLYKLLAKFK